jgi:CRISPR-associated protein Cmr6
MPHPACRQRVSSLAGEQAFDNPGLALARYLPRNGDDHAAARALLSRAQQSKASEAYKTAYARYQNLLPNPVQQPLDLGGPLAVGLGMSSPLEVGLTLSHTYGMPVIPGSAIKGVCRDVAEALVNEKHITPEQFTDLMGDTSHEGLCVFYDAWYDPSSVDGKPFHRDVVTVHHPEYYQNKGATWPTDFDDPTPVPFLVVKPGAQFLFAVGLPAPEWEDFVRRLLIYAMRHHGVGGKTRAGYGWLEEPGHPTVPGDAPHTPAHGPHTTEPTQPLKRWPHVTATKQQSKQGRFTVVLSDATRHVSLDQGAWTRLTAKWPPNDQRLIHKGQLTVTVMLQPGGATPTVVSLEIER